MHFVFYPKHQYGCPHVGHCPHLGGASLGTLVHAADRETEWTDALHRQIDSLRAENSVKYYKIEELTARIEQLQRELKAERQKQFKRKKEDPATDGPESTPLPGKKKRGAPAGHPGWYRKRPVAFDALILVAAPCQCPRCDAAVKARPDRPVYDHLQEDWIDGRRLVVCYRHEAGRCRKCRRWVQQAGPGELLRARIGPNLRAAGMFLQYDIGLTTRKVVRAIAGLALFAFVPATLLGFGREAARKAKPLAQDVAEKLRALVILRKLTFGNRTRAGAKRLGTMMTVIETAKRQGRNALKFLVTLFTMPSNQAMRAMYARA